MPAGEGSRRGAEQRFGVAAILIVEDDGRVAAHMARTLREAGHSSILAPDACAALQEGLLVPEEAPLLLLGSVAERVVRKASCPVLTVRQEEHGSL